LYPSVFKIASMLPLLARSFYSRAGKPLRWCTSKRQLSDLHSQHRYGISIHTFDGKSNGFASLPRAE
ncbi:MAG: hypothetical protein WA426_20650, partial [Silvibacterium sp.]